MQYCCPYCGSAARLLFNLVMCLTSGCRNFDVKFQKEWSKNNKLRYRHNEYMGYEHIFLGNFTSKESTIFDLYKCKTSDAQLALARFGDDDVKCYYVDFKEREIGNLSSGPVRSLDSYIEKALKEALKRARI